MTGTPPCCKRHHVPLVYLSSPIVVFGRESTSATLFPRLPFPLGDRPTTQLISKSRISANHSRTPTNVSRFSCNNQPQRSCELNPVTIRLSSFLFTVFSIVPNVHPPSASQWSVGKVDFLLLATTSCLASKTTKYVPNTRQLMSSAATAHNLQQSWVFCTESNHLWHSGKLEGNRNCVGFCSLLINVPNTNAGGQNRVK